MIRSRAIAFGIMGFAVASTCAAAPSAELERHSFEDLNGLPILSVRVGDSEPLPFLLDTGASPCVVDSAFAPRLGIETGATTERRGGAGLFTGGVAKDPLRLRIDDARLTCSETLVTDLSGVTDVIGKRLAGIVGGDFFRDRIVAIDYDQDVVTVHDRAGYSIRVDAEVIPIRVENNRPYLTARLSVPGGAQDVARELLIDTGSLDSVADPLLEQSNALLKPVSATGLGRGFQAAAGTFSRVRIGSLVFEDVPGVVPSVPIVGVGLISRFNPVFNYDGGWMILEERP